MLRKIIGTIGVSFLQTILFALILFLIERLNILMVYVEIGSGIIGIAESALFLFIMLFISNLIIEFLKYKLRYGYSL